VHKYLHPRFIDQFENDARVQVRFHLSAAYFWLFSMVGVLFVPTFKGNFAALLIMEVSLLRLRQMFGLQKMSVK
jgi:hypothetical protein